jgi:hypothetical protein
MNPYETLSLETALKMQVLHEGRHWMLLTWDRAMIMVGKQYSDCGMVVSPDVANDFTTCSQPFSDSQLCVLAHSLAMAQDQPQIITARILDRIAHYASDKIMDWKFQEEIRRFIKEQIERIDFDQMQYDDSIEHETDEFLREAGISL